MKRREFITLVGGAAAWPLAARAQQSAMPVIGFLDPGSPETSRPVTSAFREGFNQAGFIEDQNVRIEFRWAEGQFKRLPALAAELVHRPVNLIVAAGSTPAIAAKAATATIPIVFYAGGDPVGLGLVPSFNRPEGNVTGVARVSHALAAKRLELLDEIVPKSARISLLVHAKNVNTPSDVKELEHAANIVGRRARVFTVSSNGDIDAAFESMAAQRDGAVLVNAGRFFEGQRERLIELAANHRIPAIYDQREYVDVGGLMSYGGSVTALYRQAGVYAARILKGEKPADLPVQQPTRFELVLNLKTAKTLGLDVTPTVLARADEVIE